MKITRARAAITVGGLAWFLGLGSAFSFNIMAHVNLLPGKTFFDTMDYVSNNIILPVGGVLIATFTGWFLKQSILDDELGHISGTLKSALTLLIKFVAPLSVLIVFVMSFS